MSIEEIQSEIIDPVESEPYQSPKPEEVTETKENAEGVFEVSGTRGDFSAHIPSPMRDYFLSTADKFAQDSGVKLSISESKKIFSSTFKIEAVGDKTQVEKFGAWIKDFGK